MVESFNPNWFWFVPSVVEREKERERERKKKKKKNHLITTQSAEKNSRRHSETFVRKPVASLEGSDCACCGFRLLGRR